MQGFKSKAFIEAFTVKEIFGGCLIEPYNRWLKKEVEISIY